MAVTGRSAAKKAGRLSKALEKDKERLGQLQRARDFRVTQAQNQAALSGAYGLPGGESSGTQALLGQGAIQYQTQSATQRELDQKAKVIKAHMKRAQKASQRFGAAMTIASIITMGAGAVLGKAAGTVAAEAVKSTVKKGLLATIGAGIKTVATDPGFLLDVAGAGFNAIGTANQQNVNTEMYS